MLLFSEIINQVNTGIILCVAIVHHGVCDGSHGDYRKWPNLLNIILIQYVLNGRGDLRELCSARTRITNCTKFDAGITRRSVRG
jgi:hypothetical protein